MAASNKKNTVDRKAVISAYMEYVLEQEEFPKSVYKFCKHSKIKEEEFYEFFGSITSINTGIWDTFYSETIDAITSNKEYSSFSNKEKMLSFFYAFFELLNLNRSYVLMVLNYHQMPLKNLKQLKGVRSLIKQFARQLAENYNEDKTLKIAKNPVSIYSEGAWLQFLFLLKFWMEDDSAGFEKTDIAIEKSVTTIFDLLDTTPLEGILDFGKFLWKEKSMWN